MKIHNQARLAELSGDIVRPTHCETCKEDKYLVRHHRDYDKPTQITWLCYSCHNKEHIVNKALRYPIGKEFKGGPRKSRRTDYDLPEKPKESVRISGPYCRKLEMVMELLTKKYGVPCTETTAINYLINKALTSLTRDAPGNLN